MNPKLKLLAPALLVSALALSSQPSAWANGLCPADSCAAFNTACANNGGNPLLPVPTGETCYTLPGHTQYDIAIAECQTPSGSTFRECYW
jgi:hypothetical protein